MPQKSIWVAEKERELFERAERYARDRRLTFSALVAAALEAYLSSHDADN
jgi:hypothetical protein